MTSEKGYFRSALINLGQARNQVYALQVFLEHGDDIRLENNDLAKLTQKMAESYTNTKEMYGYTMEWLTKALENRLTNL